MRFIETLLPAHFTRLNRIIFILSLLFSIVAFIALLKITPKDEDTARKLLATLVEEEQYVTRKFSNALSFTEVKKGDGLFNGDQIFTGDNSRARIVFLKSKNVLNIPPRGLVKIEEGESGENVEIQKGLAEFIIQKDQKLNIIQGTETLVLTSASTGSGVGDGAGTGKIFFNNDKLIVQVKSGQVNINDSKGKVQAIKKDETVSVSAIEKVITKIITSGLSSPSSDKKVDIWEGLDLVWSHNGAIEATLSKTSDFSEVVGKVTANTSPYKWMAPLEVGKYYLKVKVVDPKAKDESPISLTTFSPHMINTFVPEDNATVNLKRGEDLHLSWNEVPAEKYRISIETSDGQKNTYLSSKPEVVLPAIKASSIEWSVAPLLKSSLFLDYTAKKKVNITFEGENKIVAPKMGQVFNFGKDKIQLTWTSMPCENLHMKITDSNEQEILNKDMQGTQSDFTPKSPGRYTLSISSKDYPALPAASTTFLVQSVAAQWLSKETIKLESIDPEEKNVEMKFETLNKNLSELELVVFGDENLKTKLRSGKVLSKTVKYPVKNFGTYCLMVQAFDKNSPWLPSSSKCIVYTQTSAFDKMPAPKNTLMKFEQINGVASYSFEVPVVPRATIYEVQVFRDQLGKSLVYTDRSNSNVFKWPTKKAGVYFYKYHVFDSKQRSSDYSGMAKLAFPISPLSEW
jgi:hypothetical protein